LKHASVSLRPWLPIVALWLALCGTPGVQAGPPGAPANPLSASEARKWLLRIHSAAHEQNYQGTLVFSADGALSSSRVAHFCDGAQSYERVESLDGPMQGTYRHNDRVLTLWSHSRVALIEEREPRQASLHAVIEPRAEEQYELREQGVERVAGREAQVLLLSPRDAHRFAQRLWVDSQTGLPLRTDVLGAQQQVLASGAFSQIDIGVKARPATVLQPMQRLEGYRQVRPLQVPTQLEAEGWTLKAPVPGFRLAGCTKRTLDASSADPASAQPLALQAVFSDGLTQVSLFIEALDGARQRQPLLMQTGATATLMQPFANEWWVTVIGDVPASTLKQFFLALERRR
jgi:sigma-E factor negative regulatory protein RseB